MKEKFLKFIPGLVIMTVFYILAIVLWKLKDYPLFLVNFIILGTLIGLGFGLWPLVKKEYKDIVRKIIMILVGSYIFFGFGMGLIYPFFGYLRTENFQLEGFWFYLILGGFAGTVYHYAIAKIFGTFLWGRTFCGWACWTTIVLDFLPWKNNNGRINKRWEYFRYIHFIICTTAVIILLFVFNYNGLDIIRLKSNGLSDIITKFHKYITLKELWWFVIGNCLYYFIAVIIAFILKDNRAFCKYACPITVFMKIGSIFLLFKIKTDKNKCEQCGLCEKNCLMDIKITDYTKEGKRVTASECIQCRNCVRVCPNNALSLSFGFDAGFRDKINRKKQ